MTSTFTRAGCLVGARLTLPLLPGLAVFGSAFGAAAAQKGLSFEQAVGMSAFVFAGAAQMVALEVWRGTWWPGALLEAVTVTAIINSRMILMGAALQPWMERDRGWRNALTLFFLTDANWLVGTRYRAEGGTDFGVVLGSGLALWVWWVATTIPGYWGGALVPDPKRFGLDLLLPIFFASMLVPLWKGFGAARPWLLAGLVALVVHALLPGYVFIIAGALTGALAGALLDDR